MHTKKLTTAAKALSGHRLDRAIYRACRSCVRSCFLLTRLVIEAFDTRDRGAESGHDDWLLTAEEVAERSKLSAKTIHREARRGRLAYVRVGRRRLFREEDVDTWVRMRVTGRDDGSR